MRFSCNPRTIHSEHVRRQEAAVEALVSGNPYAEAVSALIGHLRRHGYKLRVVRMNDGVLGRHSGHNKTIYISREHVAKFLAGERSGASIVYTLAHETAHIYTSDGSPYSTQHVLKVILSLNGQKVRALNLIMMESELVADMAAVRICRGLGVPLSQVNHKDALQVISCHQNDISGCAMDDVPGRAVTQRYALAVADEILFQSPEPSPATVEAYS